MRKIQSIDGFQFDSLTSLIHTVEKARSDACSDAKSGSPFVRSRGVCNMPIVLHSV